MRIVQDQAHALNRTENLKNALGVISSTVEQIEILERFVDLMVEDLAVVSNYREAQRMLDRLLKVAEGLTGNHVARVIENSIKNNQVHRSGCFGGQMAELFKRTVICSCETKADWESFYRFTSLKSLPSDMSEIQQLIESTILKDSSETLSTKNKSRKEQPLLAKVLKTTGFFLLRISNK